MDPSMRPRALSTKTALSIEKTRRLLSDPETRDTALPPHLPVLSIVQRSEAASNSPRYAYRSKQSTRSNNSPQQSPTLVCVPASNDPVYGLRKVTSRGSSGRIAEEDPRSQVFAYCKNRIDTSPNQFQDQSRRLADWTISISPEDPPTHLDEEFLVSPAVNGLKSGPRTRRATSPALSTATAFHIPSFVDRRSLNMDHSHLDPFSAAGSRPKQAQDAKDMQQVVIERAARTGSIVPPYDFLELIGKGSFGRVYKCKHKETREIVAVKIIDVDELDYKLDNKQKDEAIEDFIKEVNTLKQVKDSKAKNINHIQEAFDLHSQLWIVSDYCSGGSVHTLMKSSDEPGLEESFLIPIARELAIALKHVHDAGVIHRDIKCGNVLISEDGRLQLCDFGVAARMENEVSKRSTIIGTPYWMAPEMHSDTDQGYGFEIDCWAFGCTIYEMATGMPPNHNFHPMYLRSVLKSAPRLDEEMFSAELCDFVAFCLQEEPENRPSARQIMEHPYISGTEFQYPTESLRMLIDRYIHWERKGGQRMSLFNAGGAAAPQLGGEQEVRDEWIFSTTANYDKDYERRYSHLPTGIAALDLADSDDGGLPAEIELPPGPGKHMTPLEEAKEESRANRGERYLERLFDANADPYDYDTTNMDDESQPLSDLPLRNLSGSDRAANRETLIDLDCSGLDMPPTFSFDFSDVPTVKGSRKSALNPDEDEDQDYYESQGQDTRRATKDWTFPSLAAPAIDKNATMKRATKDWKFPSFEAPAEEPVEEEALDLTNRRTMDWTFATAGSNGIEPEPETSFHIESMTLQGTTAPNFRPNLTRIATEPVGQFNDFLHPPEGSLDVSRGASRESTPMIDLDFGEELQKQQTLQPDFVFEQPTPPEDGMMRSSSPLSLTNSMSSIGPFDLEQDPLQREEDMKRYSHKRQQPSYNGPSVAERRASRFLSTNQGSDSSFASRARGASIDSTASSIADEMGDGSSYNRDYNLSIQAQMRDQLRKGLQRTFSQTGRPHMPSDSYGDIYTNGQGAAQMPRHNTHGYDTDSSIQDEPLRLTNGRNKTFPQLVPPGSYALHEGAGQEDMFAELDKALEAAQEAFGFTANILREREAELDGSEAGGDSASEATYGVTSEEEREFERFA